MEEILHRPDVDSYYRITAPDTLFNIDDVCHVAGARFLPVEPTAVPRPRTGPQC